MKLRSAKDQHEVQAKLGSTSSWNANQSKALRISQIPVQNILHGTTITPSPSDRAARVKAGLSITLEEWQEGSEDFDWDQNFREEKGANAWNFYDELAMVTMPVEEQLARNDPANLPVEQQPEEPTVPQALTTRLRLVPRLTARQRGTSGHKDRYNTF